MLVRHLLIAERSAYQRLEDVVGCKWSAAVVGACEDRSGAALRVEYRLTPTREKLADIIEQLHTLQAEDQSATQARDTLSLPAAGAPASPRRKKITIKKDRRE